MADERCTRCWNRNGLVRWAPEGARPVPLCAPCRDQAPIDPLAFREVFLRFGSAREMVSHYGARDEQEALRKLCTERRLEFKRMRRALEEHANGRSAIGFGEFTRPYGYQVRDGALRVKPQEARTVGLIFEMYLEGLGIARICRELNEHDIRTKTGKRWASQTVANILRNPLYCGYAKENGSLRSGSHRAIVDKETFSRVQVEMTRRIRRPDQRAESRLFHGPRGRRGGERR